MLKIYACTVPVSRPNKFITTGKINGEMLNKIAMIIPPLIILPNNRTAKAKVRETSPIKLNGSIIQVGSKKDLKYPKTPCLPIP